MVNSSPDYSIPENSGGFLRKLLVIALPILIIVGFVVATSVIISMNKKPKEKKKSFNTLAVIADYAKIEDVQLKVKTQGEARPQIEIDLVPNFEMWSRALEDLASGKRPAEGGGTP